MSPAAKRAAEPVPRVDGRRLRAERTRESIADALLELLSEGDLRPTAGRVADRAGISERLIYHHFDDMEALLQVVAERQVARARALVEPIDRTLTRAGRIRALAEQRARLYEITAPVRRVSVLHEPFSESISRFRAQTNAELREQVAGVFAAELDPLGRQDRKEAVAALDATFSWPTWDVLTSQDGLSRAAAIRTIGRLAAALLADVAGPDPAP